MNEKSFDRENSEIKRKEERGDLGNID